MLLCEQPLMGEGRGEQFHLCRTNTAAKALFRGSGTAQFLLRDFERASWALKEVINCWCCGGEAKNRVHGARHKPHPSVFSWGGWVQCLVSCRVPCKCPVFLLPFQAVFVRETLSTACPAARTYEWRQGAACQHCPTRRAPHPLPAPGLSLCHSSPPSI